MSWACLGRDALSTNAYVLTYDNVSVRGAAYVTDREECVSYSPQLEQGECLGLCHNTVTPEKRGRRKGRREERTKAASECSHALNSYVGTILSHVKTIFT